MQLSYMIWMRGGNYYEYWKSDIGNSKRTAINTRAIWVVISCDTANSFKLGKRKKLSGFTNADRYKQSI